MEDDKGLDLSLGLPTGRSSSKPSEKGTTSADTTSNGADKTSKILNDFKNFLSGGIPQQPQGSYFNPMVDEKRKNLSEDTNHHKKQETENQNSDLQEKGRNSHISITTDEGSTADNEDVADSEAETSRLVSNVVESSKKHVDTRASSEASKGNHSPLAQHSVSSLNVPGSINFKDAANPTYPVSGMIQPSMSSDRTQTLNAGSAPMMFGYSHGQLPLLDKGSPWGTTARPPLFLPYSGRPLSASANQGLPGGGKQSVVEEGSSSRAEEDAKLSQSPVVFRGQSSTDTQTDNTTPSEYPTIRPGMAADIKFGGSGTLPNLPWVSTTGPGPNGRTISGVTYRFSANQIKIVCACHGLHMSPDDFIQHASEDPPPVADSTGGGGGGVAPMAGTSNAAASAKS